jgi:hypothetical protein
VFSIFILEINAIMQAEIIGRVCLILSLLEQAYELLYFFAIGVNVQSTINTITVCQVHRPLLINPKHNLANAMTQKTLARVNTKEATRLPLLGYITVEDSSPKRSK